MSTRVDLCAWFGPEAARLAERVRIATRSIGDAVDGLLPEELAAVRGAAPARVREFACGRALARELLRSLGAPDAALLRGADRAPRWPAGTVGSVSHAGDLCAVAVARASELDAIGIDLERERGLERDLWPEVATARELRALATLPESERALSMMRLFVSKEAAYKCLHTRVGRILEFHEVEVEPRAATRFGVLCPGAPEAARACEGFVGSHAGWTLSVCMIPMGS